MKTKSSFRLGDKVMVIAVCDPEGDKSFIGCIGEIAAQSEFCNDTLHTVKLPDGRKDGFFSEELDSVKS